MNIFLRSMPPDSPETWLAIATRGLGEKAQAEIAREIHGHYDEAFRDAHQAGATLKEALDVALASLGDPREARRGFLQTHLTRAEERTVRWGKSNWQLLVFLLLLWVVVYELFVEPHFPRTNGTFFVFLCYVYAVPVIRRYLGGALKLLIPAHLSFMVLFALLATQAVLLEPGLLPWLAMQGLVLPLFLRQELVLRRKLMRMTRAK